MNGSCAATDDYRTHWPGFTQKEYFLVHTVPSAQIFKNKKVPSNRISIIPRTNQLSLNGCEIARLLSNAKAKPIGRDP